MKEKDSKVMLEAATKAITQIGEDVKAMQMKSKADDADKSAKIDELKKAVDMVKATHDVHSDSVKALTKKAEEIEKSINDLDLRTKGRIAAHLGQVNEKSFLSIYSKAGGVREQLMKGANMVSMTMSGAELNTLRKKAMQMKAAGNMTETGNYLDDFVIAPDRLPGFFAPPLRPVHIRDIINQSPTASPIINYTVESGYNDGSGSTAQGSTAAQSDFQLTAKQTTLQKINQYVTVSKEMLEDTPLTQNYISTRLVGRMLMFEDNALLYGDGNSPNQNGITPVASAYNQVVIPGASPAFPPNYYDILMQAITQATTAYYKPSYIVLHPADYNVLAMTKDNYGRYQFPQMITGMPDVMNVGGAKILVNTAVTQGYFLVGDFDLGGTMFTKDEVEITFSTQNATNFIQGYVTVLIEERIAQVIYRPTAFIYGNFASSILSGS